MFSDNEQHLSNVCESVCESQSATISDSKQMVSTVFENISN